MRFEDQYVRSWRNLDVCPKCGERAPLAYGGTVKLDVVRAPEYRCECITDEEWAEPLPSWVRREGNRIIIVEQTC